MWSYKPAEGKNIGSGAFYELMYEGKHVLYARTWALSCCGLGELFGIGYGEVFKDKDKFKSLQAYLNKNSFREPYRPHEWLVSLSGNQLQMMPEFPKFKGVKLIDTLTNKAHSSSGINIFRISDDV